ncbi:unnamed protein product [Rotaria sp. Silwood2]|nr:unnamed protein product [Rotaria sp. Silwood2]CAF4618842.1 unnamed protein product [Rotaria sp. Silwood2]CAF4736274.1 unnamed protein product [Rotaria sp. Silwood2]
MKRKVPESKSTSMATVKRYRANESELSCRHRAWSDVEIQRSNVANKMHVEAIIVPKYSVAKRIIIPKLMKTSSMREEQIK